MDKGLKLAIGYTTVIGGLFIAIMIIVGVAEKNMLREAKRKENRRQRELVHEKMRKLIRDAHITFDSCSAIFRDNDLLMIENGIVESVVCDTQTVVIKVFLIDS